MTEVQPGGDVLLTVVTGHVDGSVAEDRRLDVLDLGDDLGDYPGLKIMPQKTSHM